MKMEIVLREAVGGGWLSFTEPRRTILARRVDEVAGALEAVELAVEDDGLTAVGFLSYEAAPAFDPAYRTREPAEGVPLLCFGLFERVRCAGELPGETAFGHSIGEWGPTQSADEHRESVRIVRQHIARGDTYQVNHTLRLRTSFEGDPKSFFNHLVRSQPNSYAAYLDLGDLVVCSASPELFFRLDGDRIESRPMKGTAGRGWSLETDRKRREWLATSEKNRAENAMIVDMVRNDLGRVARNGSVEVTRRFEVERHPTIFQMTSTVKARTGASVAEIVSATFPFASVTGAPKIRTMELISEFENEPRGVYTGAIGIIEPGRKASFSVGIRTAVIDRRTGTIEYGVGSGIVWDSEAADEFDECVAKARVLSEPAPEFELLETMIWTPGEGFGLLDRHLDRIAGAADYFDRPFDRNAVLEALREVPGPEFRSCAGRVTSGSPGDEDHCGAPTLGPPPSFRVRLLLAADGSIRVEAHRFEDDPDAPPVRLGLAVEPVGREDPFLHFKTTHRTVYERARSSRPDCDDVLLWTEQGEVTESTIANLVAGIGGEMVTPPVACGLLNGTFRAELLAQGRITERVIVVDELAGADELFLINSVQGRRKVEWVS